MFVNFDDDEGFEVVINCFDVLFKVYDNDGFMMWEGDFLDCVMFVGIDVDGDG